MGSELSKHKGVFDIEDGNAKNYFVSFIDILGFENFVKKNPIETTYNSLNRVLVDILGIHVDGEENASYMWTDENAYKKFIKRTPLYFKEIAKNNFYNFSDSIIFYVEEKDQVLDNIERFRSICFLSNIFISKSILESKNPKEKAMSLQCGISYGKMIIDKEKKIHIGQPLIDAYKTANNQEWMGGAIHSSAHSFIRPFIEGYDQEIIQYEVPFKRKFNENKIKYKFALNWVKHHPSHPRWVKDCLSPGPTLLDIGYHLKKYEWDSQITKRNNTIKFVCEIDRKWNVMHRVEKSTERDFTHPPGFE